MAFASKWLSAPSPERSSRFVAGSRRDGPSGTCFTQTAIFIPGGMLVVRRRALAHMRCLSASTSATKVLLTL